MFELTKKQQQQQQRNYKRYIINLWWLFCGDTDSKSSHDNPTTEWKQSPQPISVT